MDTITMYSGASNNIVINVTDKINLALYSIKMTFKKDENSAWSKSYTNSDNIQKSGQNLLLHIAKNDFVLIGTYSFQIAFENDVDMLKSEIGQLKVLHSVV